MPLITISAPSRLHFGLWSLAGGAGRQFGGVGVMVDEPGLRLTIAPAPGVQASGLLAARAVEFAERWGAYHQCEPRCHIDIVSAPPDHVGLGTGTQLALAVAAGLGALHDLDDQSPQSLAASVSRGLRSAVGTYGFSFGGLIVEQGKLPDEEISPLDCRLDVPPSWRFVLVRPRGLAGLAGDDELAAIGELPAVPPAMTDELMALAHEKIVPAVVKGDFPAFADGIFAYGKLAGEIFAARQGGPYNGPALAALVARIRDLGYAGVGQSSWGPTLFAAASSPADAERLASSLCAAGPSEAIDIVVARPSRDGAGIERQPRGAQPLGEQAIAK